MTDHFVYLTIILTYPFCVIYFRGGNLGCVKVLLEANPKSLHSMEYRLRTPIHYAAFEGHVHLVKFLLDRGANADQRFVVTPYLMFSELQYRALIKSLLPAFLTAFSCLNCMSSVLCSELRLTVN